MKLNAISKKTVYMDLLKKITLAETKEALVRSGYLLEHRIENILRREGFYVQANDAYLDKETSKSRELDIYALQLERLGNSNWDGFIWNVVLIECINNTQPLAFITKKPAMPELHAEEIKLAGLPVKVFNVRKSAWGPLFVHLGMEQYHHYCRGRIATQFCSFTRKKSAGDWMASHEDSHFDAFRTLMTALEYAKDKFFESWVFDRRTEFVNVEFYYPILVLQGSLLEIRSRGVDVDITEVSHVQHRRSLIWNGKERDYQIDVVTEKYFPKYLAMIGKELSETAGLMRRPRTKAEVQRSLLKIVGTAKRLRSPQKIRAAMEYKWRGLAL